MNISPNGISLIKSFEGLRLDAYTDSDGILTIGYGHTGLDVTPDLTITEGEAEQILMQDLESEEKCVNNCVKVALTQSQFDALVSFTYNLGCGSLRNSILLLKLNDGDDTGAATEFIRWCHVKGEVSPGLLARREAEQAMFLA